MAGNIDQWDRAGNYRRRSLIRHSALRNLRHLGLAQSTGDRIIPAASSSAIALLRNRKFADSPREGTAFERGCVKTPAFDLRVESSSRFLQSETQKFWRRLSEEGNRENDPTVSSLAHVFTRPGTIGSARAAVTGSRAYGHG